MNDSKIIRTVCVFRGSISGNEEDILERVSGMLKASGFVIQTNRVCSPLGFGEMESFPDNIFTSIGGMTMSYLEDNLSTFYKSKDNFNLELANEVISLEHVDVLFDIIEQAPAKTFNLTYVFNNAGSSPYMPSATYVVDGFSVGLQPTDLAVGCTTLEEWFQRSEVAYSEIMDAIGDEEGFLGIDSSIAPLFEGTSSLVNFIKKIDHRGFSHSVTTDIYTQITAFIKENNPKPIGLCGIMLPCLEDFELAHEYEKGEFSVERNIFLSLHSGLGIDTYPIGVDERPERVLEILQLVQALSNKYSKSLSVRFVSDGKAKIGDKTDYQNSYLYDVFIQSL